MKRLIAHPEWDAWIIWIAVLTPGLLISSWWFTTHGTFFQPNGKPGLWSLLGFGAALTVPCIAALVLSEARNARSCLAVARQGGTLRGYLSAKVSIGILVFVAGVLLSTVVMPLPNQDSADHKVLAVLFSGAMLGVLVRRSRLSPWSIPTVELNATGIVMTRPALSSSPSALRRQKSPGAICMAAWDCIESIDWHAYGKYPKLDVVATKTLWFRTWKDYLSGAQPFELKQKCYLKLPLGGDTIPPDAVTLISKINADRAVA